MITLLVVAVRTSFSEFRYHIPLCFCLHVCEMSNQVLTICLVHYLPMQIPSQCLIGIGRPSDVATFCLTVFVIRSNQRDSEIAFNYKIFPILIQILNMHVIDNVRLD